MLKYSLLGGAILCLSMTLILGSMYIGSKKSKQEASQSIVIQQSQETVPVFELVPLKVLGHNIEIITEDKIIDLAIWKPVVGTTKTFYDYDYEITVGISEAYKIDQDEKTLYITLPEVHVLDAWSTNFRFIDMSTSGFTASTISLKKLFDSMNEKKFVDLYITDNIIKKAEDSLKDMITKFYAPLGFSVEFKQELQ